MEETQKLMLIAGAALVLVLLLKKNGIADAAAGIASAAVGAAGQVASGAVLGIGDAVGLPRTNMEACDQALADGRTWDASFACPASYFLSHAFGGSSSPRAPDPASLLPIADLSTTADGTQYDAMGNVIH